MGAALRLVHGEAASRGSHHVTLYFSTNTVPPQSFPRAAEQAQHALGGMDVWANGSENIWYVSLAPWVAKSGGR